MIADIPPGERGKKRGRARKKKRELAESKNVKWKERKK